MAVMRRLGLRFYKNVQYPLGAGVDIAAPGHRDDVGPIPKPVLIPLA
jgi:hypothetical protein